MTKEEQDLLYDALKVLGSFLWLQGNIHNYGSDLFKNFLEASFVDAKDAYNNLLGILKKNNYEEVEGDEFLRHIISINL